MDAINHQFRLAARPVGMPKRSDWTYAEDAVRDPGEGEILVKILDISLDPAMRGWMNEGRSYIAPVALGGVMRALGAGRVIASRNPGFGVGDFVTGLFGVQEYAISGGEGVIGVDTRFAALQVYLSALGMPGMTGYFGLLDIGRPKPGETVVISGAAGAVGAVAGQIAKIKECQVIGIAGGPEKCRYLVNDLGFDASIDYKTQDLGEALRHHCPEGVNVYFDNVGGEILDTVLLYLARRARVVICGAISQYNNTTPVRGPSNYLSLLVNHARMEGFVVTDFLSRHGEAAREMAGWLAAGRIKPRQHVVSGLESFPDALLMLYTGQNFGKLVLHVADS
jgi:NADPH-dependent curcumin reductase CurA